MLSQMSLTEIMHSTVETVEPDTLAIDVGRRLRERDIGSVVVVDDDQAVGIVTESDLVELLVAGDDSESVTARECMSSPLVTIDASASITEAASLLREHHIKKLPVLSDGELAGITTTTDLSSYLPQFSVRRSKREVTEGRLPRASPEMAYEEEGWQFEYRDEETEGVFDIGDVVEFSKVISDDDVRSFAEMSGDTNRLHLDSEFAEQTRFEHRIVHGTLVTGLISAALARIPGLTIYLSQDISYLGPIAIGERVTAVCEVSEELDDDKYRLSTDVYNEDGNRVLEGEAVVLLDDLPEATEQPAETEH
jgi:predicted transcriptional regulator/acyl dehydratase